MPNDKADTLIEQSEEVLFLCVGDPARQIVHDNHVVLEIADVIERRVRGALPDLGRNVVEAGP